jgi:hypothetical protein
VGDNAKEGWLQEPTAHEIIEKIAAQWINIRRDKLGGSLFLW